MAIGGKESAIVHEKAGNTSNDSSGKRASTGRTLTVTDFYSKVQASSVESRQNAQNSSTSCPRQGCVLGKGGRTKGRCQSGQIEEASRRISYPLLKDRNYCPPEQHSTIVQGLDLLLQFEDLKLSVRDILWTSSS